MKERYADLITWCERSIMTPILSVEHIVSTPYSVVLKITTEKHVYYLKQVPQPFLIEAEILKSLRETRACRTVPELVACNLDLKCFITKSCGMESLRSFFDGQLDVDLLRQGFDCYNDIQKETIPYIDLFLQQGVSDWRTHHLPFLYKNLLQDKRFTDFIALSSEDIRGLQGRILKLQKLCDDLIGLGIPDTLNHADFQSNNILIDPVSGKISVIDWGEVYIGNPLLSRYYGLVSAKYQYNMKNEADDYMTLQNALLGSAIKDKDFVIRLLDGLYPVIHSLAWHALLEKTGYGLPSSKAGRIRNVLLTF